MKKITGENGKSLNPIWKNYIIQIKRQILDLKQIQYNRMAFYVDIALQELFFSEI